MNAPTSSRWRQIVRNAATEPRHFFFWLTLLGLLVLFTTILIMALNNDAANLLASWIVLAALLGIAIGVPAFVLAWIPPVRRFFARLLEYKLLCAVAIATLVALFYALENWRGRTAWKNLRAQAEKSDLTFDAEKIIPREISAAANMFEAPPWTELQFTRSGAGGVTFQDPEANRAEWFNLTGARATKPPELANLFTARRTDLAEWQAFYRGSNNVYEAANGTTTNYFPVSAPPQTPAQDVLLALSRYDERLAQLRAAAERPDARFWINYEDGFGALLPHLAKVKGTTSFLRLRATALLTDGQTDAALQDVLLALRINRAIEAEPILISQLVAIAGLHISLTPIWEGMADHRWNETQLTALERELARHDFLANYHHGMSGERYFSVWTMDYLKRAGDPYELFEMGTPDAQHAGLDRALGKTFFRLVPSGWFEQNKAALGRMHLQFIHPLVNQQKHLVSPDQLKLTSEAVEEKSARRSPYDFFSGLLLPALDKAAKRFAVAQSYLDLARVAIALERHRLANGNYPTNLTALAPKFLPEIPHDLITGEPLHYSRTENNFVLYSVGWNQTDNGGQVGLRPTKNENSDPAVDHDQGDWVWTYPAN